MTISPLYFQSYFFLCSLSLFLASSGTTANVYLLKYTGDLDVVASDPISRGLEQVTNRSGSTSTKARCENGERRDDCYLFVRELFASASLTSVCLSESLNDQKTKRENKRT